MRRLRIALAILAIFVIGTVTAASASAEELDALPEAGPRSPVTFHISSRAGVFNAKTLLEVKCRTDLGTGEFLSKRLGKFRVTFKECENTLTRTTCRGLESLPEQIDVEGEFHLRRLLAPQREHIVVFFLVNPTHFICGSSLAAVLGCVAGLLLPVDTLSRTGEVNLALSGTRQAITEGDTDAETGMASCGPLKAAVNEGTEQEGTEETKEELSGFSQGEELVMVL